MKLEQSTGSHRPAWTVDVACGSLRLYSAYRLRKVQKSFLALNIYFYNMIPKGKYYRLACLPPARSASDWNGYRCNYRRMRLNTYNEENIQIFLQAQQRLQAAIAPAVRATKRLALTDRAAVPVWRAANSDVKQRQRARLYPTIHSMAQQ
ncbi:jg26321 [Pararge aegeria aegeria]|uniref:Jg26321 protein n=1 Tax=Pararge aegeria aegeria TaxID=348720 RepID=A0A8S4R650_9NEOP|nr:jg26321 [Pararge aegeria aegeria]